VGIGGLTLEAIVLLLATPAVATAERGHVVAWHIVYLVGLIVLLVAAAAVLRRRHGLVAGSLVQPLVVAAGAITWPMYVVGLAFAAIWAYYLKLWRTG
jgi:peptidoglycan/LPS O-acetylase OafA/YrhL